MAEDLEVIEHSAGEDGGQPDPAEQEALARRIGEDLTEALVAFVRGEVPFDDLTFLLHDALQDVYFIAQGSYDLVGDEEEDWEDEGYDPEAATVEQEDLAQEPARG